MGRGLDDILSALILSQTGLYDVVPVPASSASSLFPNYVNVSVRASASCLSSGTHQQERTRSSFAAPPPSIPSQLGSSACSRTPWRDWRRRSEDAFTVPVHPLIKPWLPLFSMEQADRKKVKVFRRGKFSEAFEGFHTADNGKCLVKIP